jgi:aryl-alcohol dehydrogenase-like predicted oxidoreductase
MRRTLSFGDVCNRQELGLLPGSPLGHGLQMQAVRHGDVGRDQRSVIRVGPDVTHK